MQLMDGKALSEEIQSKLKVEIKTCMIRPSVAVIQVGSNAASDIYVKNKEKVCNSIGVYFRLFKFDEDATELSIVNKIKELNNDDYVNGIMIQLPLPEKYNEKRLINTIANSKDVEGLTDINTGRLINGRKSIVPCAPLGIMTLLEKYEVDLTGKDVCIVGCGKLVGRPLSFLMQAKGATVTICNSKTVDLKKFTSRADIVVSATGVKHIIIGDMIKEDAIVIDAGVTVEDGIIYGDVDFDSVSKKASLITPSKGGVGPMTIASLMKNITTCYNIRRI
jgi:methylenetetrahydrofolate dehydrogenase (NADP+)/methenyltetrahydrofolate cyclohydrolase